MSFKCEACGEQQDVGTRPVMVVTQVRLRDEKRGWGYEIAEEVRMCTSCAVTHTHLKLSAVTSRGSILSKSVRDSLVQMNYVRPDPDEVNDIAEALARARGVTLGELATFTEAVAS